MSTNKSKLNIVIISILSNIDEENLLILALKAKLLILATRKIDIVVNSADIYYITCKLKDVQVFTISIKDLKY